VALTRGACQTPAARKYVMPSSAKTKRVSRLKIEQF